MDAVEQHRGLPEVPARPLSERARTSQARDILFAVDRKLPFDGSDHEPLTRTPRGMTSQEYLETSVEGATAQQWMDLARALL